MNKILLNIKDIMIDCVEKYIPDVSFDELEDQCAIFYMNGKNGTEFDWYVNDKICDFMIFYDDKDNMGAVKTTLYNNGSLLIFVYGEQGKSIVQKINTYVEVEEEDILCLAVLLKNEADDMRIWDTNIEKINSDLPPDTDMINEFISNAHYYDDIRERKNLLGKIAYVSKKLLDEDWKIGYMCREEAVDENDSGWSFLAGNEEDEYVEDYRNIQLMSIHEVMQYDSVIWKYITSPVGTKLIRISSDEFEMDKNDKEIYLEKN